MRRNSSRKIVLCGIFAALTGVGAMISMPLGPVPINMVHIPIFLSAWILGPKLAMLAQIVYILMGIVGLPVFSGFTAGLGHVIGPAGGFIWSYPVVAFVSGCIFKMTKLKLLLKLIIGIVTGWSISYIVGTAYYIFLTGVPVSAAIGSCIIPFLPGDICKSIVTYILIIRLRNIGRTLGK